MIINFPLFFFAFTMAILDMIMMIMVKKYYLGEMTILFGLFIPMIIYSIQPLLFYKALYFEGMGIFNVLWDSVSNLLVLFIGITIFMEKISLQKYIGVMLSFISIFLLVSK